MKLFRTGLLSLILASGAADGLANDGVGQWIVVTPPDFRAALTPLIEHRRSEGFNVVVLETTEVLSHEQPGDGTALQERIKHLFQQQKTRNYLLLAGNFVAGHATNTGSVSVPSLRGSVGRMKNVPSDYGFGLPGEDGAPAASVGRFPARDTEELRAMVQKTLNFERDVQPAPWRDRLVLLLGNTGAGQLADFFVGQTLDQDLGSLHPSWEIRTLFDAASSPYFLPWPQDRETALKYLQDGAIFSVYLGHSGPEGLGLDTRFITRDDWAKLKIPVGGGPFFTCGCFACQPSGTRGAGYGLAAMRNATGPVAVIGAMGESFSAPGQLAAEGLLDCLAQPPFPARLGDYWLGVEAGLARGNMDPTIFALLDMADGSGGKVPLATQRLEHLEMWTLLGDPALRMPIVPADVSLQADTPVNAGKTLTVQGTLPERLAGASVRLTLERPANSMPTGMEKLPLESPANREVRAQAILANYQRATSFVVATADAKTSGNHFVGSLDVPLNLPWNELVLRATARRSEEAGLGVIRLQSKGAANVENGTGK